MTKGTYRSLKRTLNENAPLISKEELDRLLKALNSKYLESQKKTYVRYGKDVMKASKKRKKKLMNLLKNS